MYFEIEMKILYTNVQLAEQAAILAQSFLWTKEEAVDWLANYFTQLFVKLISKRLGRSFQLMFQGGKVEVYWIRKPPEKDNPKLWTNIIKKKVMEGIKTRGHLEQMTSIVHNM